MTTLLRDLGYAVRSLRNRPIFALTAIVTLALGIGASTAIFSVANAVLLRPLPYGRADQLVLVWGELRARDVDDFPFSPGDFQDLREQTTAFQDLAAVTAFRQALSGDGADPEQVRIAGVTTNLLPLLGSTVALGRGFVAADAVPQPAPPQGANAGAANAGAANAGAANAGAANAGAANAGAANAGAANAGAANAGAANAGAGNAAGNPPVAGPPPLPTIVLLTHDFWRRRYGADPGVVGRTIDLGPNRAQVVGVLAPGFELLFPPGANVDPVPDMLVAMRIDYETASRNDVFLRVVGRLKPGASLARAQEDVERVAADIRQRFPIKQTADLHFRAVPMHEDLVADVRPAIVALLGAVTFVLLISCANVANLLLVRAAARERELAVLAALGGSPWRLVRQLLAESLVLAAGGVVAGVALAHAGIVVLKALAPENLPRLDAVRIDAVVLGFAALAALLAAAVFGIVPALRASRPDLANALRSGRAPGMGGGKLLRHGVVMTEVALSFVLLVGCGLMVRSFVALQGTDPGYDPNGLLTFSVPAQAPTPEERAAFARTLRERLLALPGVQSVTAAAPLPLDGGIGNARWGTEEAVADPGQFRQANRHVVLPGYFATLRTQLRAGRVFDEQDNREDATGIVIDELLAAKAFGARPAVGQRLFVRVRSQEPEWLQVIGVVAHQRHETLAADGREALFVTDGFMGSGLAARWAVRTAGPPARLVAPVRRVVAELDPRLPVAELQPMQAFVDRAMAPTRFALVLIGVFATIAALLASVGLYGVLATGVRQRTAEIGVRMALGAPRANIFRLVLGEGLRLSAVGVVVGVAAAVLLTRAMRSMLVGVGATDPATFAAIAVLFFGITAAACWLPARRAAGLDPKVAFREE